VLFVWFDYGVMNNVDNSVLISLAITCGQQSTGHTLLRSYVTDGHSKRWTHTPTQCAISNKP